MSVEQDLERLVALSVAKERLCAVAELERRAARLRQRAGDGHPSPDEDMAAARQLEIAAGDIKAGMHVGDGT